MSAYVYDIETYRNLFLVVFINLHPKYNAAINEYIDADIAGDIERKKDCLHKLDYKIFSITSELNELGALANFIEKKELVGYNNHNYDDKLLRFILYYREYLINLPIVDINRAIYSLSNEIINTNTYYSNNPIIEKVSKWGGFYSIDLMRTHYLDSKKISLKNIAIKLEWYRIQDLPIKPYLEITTNQIRDIVDYCINDVLITRALWYSKISDIKLRDQIKEEYKLDVLSNSRSTIAEKLLYKFYTESAGYLDKKITTIRQFVAFDEIIDNDISFNNPNLQELLRKLKSTIQQVDTDFQPTVVVNNTKYQLGVGGLHSVDNSGVHIRSDKYLIRDCDVTSYYPAIIINLNACPAHLNPDIFIPILKNIMNQRIQAKINSKDKTLSVEVLVYWNGKQYVFKIIINSIFGKLGKMGGWLCDHKEMYRVTVNGQLYLLKLAEMFENAGIAVISANTDGLVCKIPVELESKYYEICDIWQKMFRFDLEYTDYSKYIRRNVNSYIAIDIFGKIKVKNDFVYDLEHDPDHLLKGYDAKIIPYALVKYYTENIPIRDTILNHDNIYWFCKSQKVGDQFNTMFYQVVNGIITSTTLQKTNRYFVSTKGGTILKQNSKGKKINILKGCNVTIFNNYVPRSIKDYNINYTYYIKECEKIINEINGTSIKTIKQSGKTLFDLDD